MSLLQAVWSGVGGGLIGGGVAFTNMSDPVDLRLPGIRKTVTYARQTVQRGRTNPA